MNDKRIKAVIIIGSAARTNYVADEYSDLDLIIATEEPDEWLYGDYPKRFGNIKISFVEDTLGGAKERRIIYKEAGDVDFIVFTPDQLQKAVVSGLANQVMNRGYIVLYDDMNITKELEKYINPGVRHELMGKEEFLNMVNDFFFHTIWAHKKIKRGELWTAKMCIDAYLKAYLLKAMEMYVIALHDIDVWHNGRFLEEWLDDAIQVKLKTCFAHYDKEDMISALLSSFDLFSELCEVICKECNYPYPEDEYMYVKDYFANNLE